MNRISRNAPVVSIALAALAGLVLAATAAHAAGNDDRFFSDKRTAKAVLAESPLDYVAGVVEMVKRCDRMESGACLDRVRLIEPAPVKAGNAGGHTVGEELLLSSTSHGTGPKKPVSQKLLVLAAPFQIPGGPRIYQARMLRENPAPGDAAALANAIDAAAAAQ